MELFRYFIKKIKRDSIMLEASSLSFTTILALIPALTVILSIFTMIPAFEPLKENLRDFATTNFLPVFSSAVSDYVEQFVAQAKKMTITGIIFLFIISLLLVRSVDKAINRIFKGGTRKASMTFAIYWTLLTVGPLAISILVSITYRIMALSFVNEENELGLGAKFIYFISPILIELIVFTTIYIVVPVCQVKIKDAFLTAVLVTIIFEISKKCFSIFILNFSSYETIYGTLAVIPVLMIWININWWITLLGAEFCASLVVVRKGLSDEIPKIIVSIAQATGDIVGSVKYINNKKSKRIKIKVQKTYDE